MRRLKSLLSITLTIIFAASTLTGCGKSFNESLEKFTKTSFDAFDTAIQYIGYCKSEEEFTPVAEEVMAEFVRYHKLFDIYHTYDGINNAKTINENAGAAPVVVDEDLIDLLKFAKELYSETDGRINIAMGSVLKLWHNARSNAEAFPEDAKLPDMEKLVTAKDHCDIDKLIIDEENSTVYLEDPLMSLDLGAVAKGYAVERVADMLIEKGIDHAAINAGGNVRTIGEKPDGVWKIGIQNPDTSDAEHPTIATVELVDKTVATTGVYERYFMLDGVRYHHVIDKDTLMPENRYLSVSIITEDSGLADALSTAVFNMDYEYAREFVDSREGIEAIFVMPDGAVIKTFE